MDGHEDPILQFFSEDEAARDDLLYTALGIEKSATAEEVRKAYRKAALRLHPDKHAAKGEDERKKLAVDFQKVGFAYAVLSDDKKRERYDKTGRTDESAFSDAEEMGWDAYFESLFERIDRKALDEDKKRYQGSEEERADLIAAYNTTKGDFAAILTHIPHSTHADEKRLITVIDQLIADGKLSSTQGWTKTARDTTASQKRKKASVKEAGEAEEAAKELGVWDEFYGSGEKGARKKDKAAAGDKDGEAGLQALILKRQREREGGLDALAAKYAKLEDEQKSKRRSKGRKVEEDAAAPPEISDADFEKLQSKLFADKTRKSSKR